MWCTSCARFQQWLIVNRGRMVGNTKTPPCLSFCKGIHMALALAAALLALRNVNVWYCLQDFAEHPVAAELLHNGATFQVRAGRLWES